MNKEKIKKLRDRTIIVTVIIIAIIGGLRTYDDLKRNQEILEIKITFWKNTNILIFKSYFFLINPLFFSPF